MNASFRIVGLPADDFASWFEMSADQLALHGASRVVADASPGFPCRVSLDDAEIGEELLLLSYEHLAEASPYRASGPIFVRRGLPQAVLEPGVVPPYITRRLMSVRAYDAAHMMVTAEVCEGVDAKAAIERLLCDEAVAYVHLHNAKRGCYFCAVERA